MHIFYLPWDFAWLSERYFRKSWWLASKVFLGFQKFGNFRENPEWSSGTPLSSPGLPTSIFQVSESGSRTLAYSTKKQAHICKQKIETFLITLCFLLISACTFLLLTLGPYLTVSALLQNQWEACFQIIPRTQKVFKLVGISSIKF